MSVTAYTYHPHPNLNFYAVIITRNYHLNAAYKDKCNIDVAMNHESCDTFKVTLRTFISTTVYNCLRWQLTHHSLHSFLICTRASAKASVYSAAETKPHTYLQIVRSHISIAKNFTLFLLLSSAF